MELEPQKYRISLVLRSVFFPLTFPDYIDSFSKKGFSLGPFPPRTLISGNRAYLSGRIATKGKTFVDIDSDRKIVACEGKNLEELISTFSEVMDIVSEDYSVPPDEIDYFEFNADVVVKSQNNPIQRLKMVYRDIELIKRFNEILGVPVSNFILTLIPSEALPTDRSWFDIRIEPRLTKPTREYFIHVVFRDKNMKKVLDFSKEVNSTIIKLLSTLEEGS